MGGGSCTQCHHVRISHALTLPMPKPISAEDCLQRPLSFVPQFLSFASIPAPAPPYQECEKVTGCKGKGF